MMDSSYTENVLAEIEEAFQDIVKENENKTDLLDEAIEEFDVVDSWEIGGVDDIHHNDISYGKSGRRSKETSYTRRKENNFQRRDESYDNHRGRQISYSRSYNSSHSKPSDYHPSPRSSRDRRMVDRNSVEHLRVSVKNSPHRVDKLPDLKCTTSVETGEINVVLLSEDRGAHSPHDEKEISVSDAERKKPPILLKNPFAYARFRRKICDSPERSRGREIVTSPRRSLEQPRRESKSFDSRNKDRSSSPIRPKSNRRASPYFYDRRNRRRSVSRSPERYPKRRRSHEYRRSRESSRWRSRSREGSVLSRVSSKSSLSFISMRGHGPLEHDRKQSPLRPCKFYNEPRQSNENYFSSSEDFNHKLTLLLKEGKQKQSPVVNESEPSHFSSYPNSAWKADNWSSSVDNAYPHCQDPGVNYSGDPVAKPNYDIQQPEYTGYPQGQYNQVYYNNNQLQNYPNTYPGNAETAVQPSYNYGNQYPNQIPNQYYMQATPDAVNYPTTSYADHTNVGQYLPMGQPLQPQAAENMGQPSLNMPQQHYNMTNDQVNYMKMNSSPHLDMLPSLPQDTSQNEHVPRSNDWLNQGNNRILTRTSIPLTQKENNSNEEDPMRTPPPPVISDTWREIESVDKGSWKGQNKKWEVLSKCERMLQRLMSNDPSMERFKVSHFDNLKQFSLQEESKFTPDLISRNAVRAARRLAKTLRFQSPLLRKRDNPHLKFAPWMPED